jgi:site-specific DNA recombinase
MKRCAIYTRKSTEEGLEQDFNSLQAQREACEAYVKSQKQEGWKLVRTRFDDGGHSGGTLDRPALQTLLGAIDRNEIDVVVVYKVDRLTRSLADFAKIVERFDERGVSFVSVTQQFNTTSSMGRLTLNVLLSFAQFEREVTAERIRDKIAASKKKGMWMGGLPPLGYDVQDKKLVVNQQEATTVRTLYRLYLEHGTVRNLLREANTLGIVTKRRIGKDGRITGAKAFSRGNLYQLLTNPLYVGKIPHKGEIYPGQHRAIIDEDLPQAVQQLLSGNAVTRQATTNTASSSLLAGLVYDETGDRLCPTHASKGGKRYRYYVSKRLIHDADKNEGWRLAAEHLEGCVIRIISKLLTDQRRLSALVLNQDAELGALKSILAHALDMADALQNGDQCRKFEIIGALVNRVDLESGSIKIALRRQALEADVGKSSRSASDSSNTLIEITEALSLKRRGVESKLVLEKDDRRERNVDQGLCQLIGDARVWYERLASGEVASVRDLGQQENISETEITRILPLAFLAPDIVETILDGRQPIEMTATSLRFFSKLPTDWAKQRHVLGL